MDVSSLCQSLPKFTEMGESSGRVWHQCPPVVTHIFKNLCARDLSTCAKVCSLWNSMSVTENNRRLFVEWFLQIGIDQVVDQDGRVIDFNPSVDKLYPFSQQLASLRVRPSLCLAFVIVGTQGALKIPEFQITTEYMRSFKRYENALERRIIEIRDCLLSPFLPDQCQIHCFASPGIIGCNDKGSPTEVKEGRAISGLLLPNFPGVHIQHFPIEKDIGKWLRTDFLDRQIKGMLIFVSSPTEWMVRGCIKACLEYNGGEEFMILGSCLYPVLGCMGSCFLFSGDNVESASVVIDSTTKDVAVELALFKKTGMLENQCFAFMSSCGIKENNKDSIPNFESSVFRNMYPDVPLAGVFGEKNIGFHFLPNVDKDDPDHKQRREKFSLKSCVPKNSTIFVLFSVKTPK